MNIDDEKNNMLKLNIEIYILIIMVMDIKKFSELFVLFINFKKIMRNLKFKTDFIEL